MNNNITPIKSYIDIEKNKSIIFEENRKKSGIYRWNNLVTNSSYIGSAINLTSRLSNYMSIKFLEKEIRRNKSRISNSLLKYGYSKFSLDILEYSDLSSLIKREQYYIDAINPEYNILKTAGSRLGAKHSAETLLKFKNRKLSPEALINLKTAKAGKAPTSSLRKINHLLATGHAVSVVNKKTNSTKIYSSMRQLSREIGINHVTIMNYVNTNKWLKDTYLITKIIK